VHGIGQYVPTPKDTKENGMTNETSQQRLDRMMAEAQRRLPVGATIKNSRGTARWNGLAWVYGQNR